MCYVYIAQAIVAAGTAYLSYEEQDAAADNARELSNRLTETANANASRNYLALQRRRLEAQKQAAEAAQKVSKDATRARGSARVGAAGAGVTGASVDALLGDFTRREQAYQARLISQETFRDQQFVVDAEAIRTNQQSQILSNQPRVQQPNFYSSALGFASSALQIDQSMRDPGTGNYYPNAWRK